MSHNHATRVVLLATVFTLIPLKYAVSAELSRDSLLSLAQSFVEKIGQKIPPVMTPPDPADAIPEGDLLILSPRLADKLYLNSSIGAIRKKKELFLSFRELCEGLDLPIRVDTENMTAQGWYILEKYTLNMDLKNHMVQSRGVQHQVSDDDWFAQDGEIFISATALQKWMKIEADVVWDNLLVDLTADTPFPIEERLLRRKRKLNNNEYARDPILPRQENPYQLASVPNAQISTSYGLTKGPDTEQSTTQSVNISTAGDLGGFTTRTFSSIDRDQGLQNFRIFAERESENADLLGALRARTYKFGDIEPLNMDLLGTSSQQLGVRATNALEGEILGSTTRVFEGDLPPDWDVELYDGDQLIGFQTVGPEGRYRFDDVELYAGDNDFRLVFYGPQGEMREEQASIPISLDEVGAGKNLYDISMGLKDTQTYVKDSTQDPDAGSPDLALSYEKGIRDGLSLSSGLHVFQANEKQKALGKIGAVARIGQTLLNMDVVTDEELETAFQTLARRSFGKHDLRVLSLFATSGFDPENGDGSPIVMREEIDLRGPMATLFGESVSYTLNASYQGYADNDSNLNVRWAQTTRMGRYTVGHSLDFGRTYSDDSQTTSTQSTFSVRRSLGKTRVRGALVYAYAPDPAWQNVTVTFSRNLMPSLQGELELDHDIGPQLTTATAQLNWQRENYIVTPRLTYDTDDELTATMNLRFGLTYDPHGTGMHMTPDLVTSRGGVHAFVYLDKDGNNKFDGTDEPIKDAKVMSVQIPRHNMTNDKGQTFLANLPEYEATDIVLDQASLGDPYYIAGFDGLSVYPRAGAPTNIEFPVHLSGELDGTIYKPAARGLVAASGLRIVLVNARGEQAFSSLSAFDGYYVVSVVPPGDYLLMINPDDLKGTGYAQPWPRRIKIGYDGKVVSDQNITLTRGQEVAVDFFKTPKPSALVKSSPPAPDHIELNFGQYKSNLLADIVHLRIRYALEDIGVTGVKISSQTQTSGKNPGTTLTAQLPVRDLDSARNICGALSGRGLSCAMTLPPQLLMEDTRVATVK